MLEFHRSFAPATKRFPGLFAPDEPRLIFPIDLVVGVEAVIYHLIKDGVLWRWLRWIPFSFFARSTGLWKSVQTKAYLSVVLGTYSPGP